MGPGDGQVALVSGGNRGIGLAVVRGLARAGMRVVMGARDLEAGERGLARLGRDSAAVHARELDVVDPASVAAGVAAIELQFGRLDVLINNAGTVLDAAVPASAPDLGVVQQTLEVNLYGAWRLSAAALPLLHAGGDGRIVNVSSGMGQLSDMGSGSPGYRVSKTALNALTRMLSAELGESVSVNSVCPGWVRTDLGGPGAPRTPEQGADTIVWLATLPRGELPTGRFFRDRREIPW